MGVVSVAEKWCDENYLCTARMGKNVSRNPKLAHDHRKVAFAKSDPKARREFEIL